MSCSNHPQVMYPCADDTIPVENALAVSGDISFDEEGSLVLTQGQTEAEIPFGFQKESSAYVFEYLYVKSLDANPADIRAVPNLQTTKKFTVAFTGAPITGNSTLYWRVKVPDGLHSCPSLQNSPKYAIIRSSQRGTIALTQGLDYVEVEFPEAQPDNDWGFDQLSIEHAIADAGQQVFAFPTVSARSQTGFTLVFGSAPTTSGYTLRWQVS